MTVRVGKEVSPAAQPSAQTGPPAARRRQRAVQPTHPLQSCPIGVVPIIWNNADLPEVGPAVAANVVMDEVARLGFDGLQDGTGFPSGAELGAALSRRGLRLAETYAALDCSADGPTAEGVDAARRRLGGLHDAGGDVLVVALGFSPGRLGRAGRATTKGTPTLTSDGWKRLAATLEELAAEARDLGHPLAFHNHAGTFVETPDELDRLVELTDSLVGLCLDTGHYTVGGGDPVAALRRYGERVVHVHLKDVALEPLERMRTGAISGFLQALEERIFFELGSGVLDVTGMLEALAARDYAGWLMVEQDTTWNPPSESAATSLGVLEFALRQLQSRSAA